MNQPIKQPKQVRQRIEIILIGFNEVKNTQQIQNNKSQIQQELLKYKIQLRNKNLEFWNSNYQQQKIRIMKEATVMPLKEKNETNRVTISFKNLIYQVSVKNPKGVLENRTILNSLSGLCYPGQVTAILGASGAGKTSLLNILAKRICRQNNISLQGEIQANGQPYNSDQFAQFSSYVMQNDVLFGTLTVRETFEFVANLKYADPQQKAEKVDYAIKTLKLERCQNTLIGNALIKGISGGERKRTSIGVELVSDPYCIMLDEPTSGLDSFTAFVIINLLKKLAHSSDRTIVFTIHQPSADIYMLFDQVMLLVHGKFIYQGKRDKMVEYFKSIGFDCPAHSNPLDYLMSIMHHEDLNHPHYQTLFNNYTINIYQQTIQQSILELNLKSNRRNLKINYIKTNNLNNILILSERNFQKRNDQYEKGQSSCQRQNNHDYIYWIINWRNILDCWK
ncbi:unnamed protein product [Paramecium sonneborni]|uniref:ABC transporter domain-containing protein n=1 Tax=Paramecium sonneborni TaxID=65129 RepID=A0A8S1R101_9CILI|nr:unnamed protein product [Paramecium sonneborni]